MKLKRDYQSGIYYTQDDQWMICKRSSIANLGWEARKLGNDGRYRLEGWFATIRDAREFVEEQEGKNHV